jgi:hypothetical protein
MSACDNIFKRHFERFYCTKEYYANDYLTIALKRLREDFIRYRKTRRFDSFEPSCFEIKESYNRLLWKLNPNLTPIVKTNKDYFEARSQIFADYYNYLYESKRIYSNKTKKTYFGNTVDYAVNEIKIHKKKVEIIHIFKPKLEPIKSVLFRSYLEIYVKCYFDFCQKHNCFHIIDLIKVSPDKIVMSKNRDESGFYCYEIKNMIMIFNSSANVNILKNLIKKNKDEVKRLFIQCR